MKILVLADIHSNWHALAAVVDREAFDVCLVLGDLVDYGTDPIPCIDWVKEHTPYCIRGNHDHAVAQRVVPRNGSGFKRLAAGTRPLHWSLLDSPRMRYLARLPVTRHLEIDGRQLHLVHATPRDAMDEYLGEDAAGWTERLRNVEADLVCVGHTHQQFHLEAGEKWVLNPGSVGQPRDGDPRAAYAVIENGRVELRRVVYDIEATLRQMQRSGVEPWVVELNAAILRTGGQLTKEQMNAVV
jgi:putative phosphoesterase